MTTGTRLAGLIDDMAGLLHEADPKVWTDDERDDVLDALGPAAIEIAGLSARIRAARVNGTPVPRPEPKRVDPKPADPPPPDEEPPPPPPPTDSSSAPAADGTEGEW